MLWVIHVFYVFSFEKPNKNVHLKVLKWRERKNTHSSGHIVKLKGNQAYKIGIIKFENLRSNKNAENNFHTLSTKFRLKAVKNITICPQNINNY